MSAPSGLTSRRRSATSARARESPVSTARQQIGERPRKMLGGGAVFLLLEGRLRQVGSDIGALAQFEGFRKQAFGLGHVAAGERRFAPLEELGCTRGVRRCSLGVRRAGIRDDRSRACCKDYEEGEN